MARQQMRVQVPEQENSLKEEQANQPDGGGASETRKDDLRD